VVFATAQLSQNQFIHPSSFSPDPQQPPSTSFLLPSQTGWLILAAPAFKEQNHLTAGQNQPGQGGQVGASRPERFCPTQPTRT